MGAAERGYAQDVGVAATASFSSRGRGAAANYTMFASASPSLSSLHPPLPKAQRSLASWGPCNGARPHGHRRAAAARG